MTKNYWLHRISHEWEASYPLLDAGYLSIGWSKWMNTEGLSTMSETDFRQVTDKLGGGRSRWSLWHFFRFQIGDWVVIPLFDKKFAIVEVTGAPAPANHYAEKISFPENSVSVTEEGVFCGERKCDIGFLVPVKIIKRDIPRSYAPAALVSRMKLRQTTANIFNLEEAVSEAEKADGPITLHDPLVEAVEDTVKATIQKRITPDNLEHIMCWYMQKKGASRVWRPAKNEKGKENGADADVIAMFDELGVIFFIQVKKHNADSMTSGWAVHQVSEYKEQMQDADDDFTYISWVVSTGRFNDEVQKLAKEKGVRLIDEDKLIRMLLDCGIGDIDSALEKE